MARTVVRFARADVRRAPVSGTLNRRQRRTDVYIGKNAVVIGAGIGGLTAAQAYAGKFEKVVVFERDMLPEGAETRAGVPQGSHPHALWPGGVAALDDLFDGFTQAMRAAGAKVDDMGVRMVYKFPGQAALSERQLGIPLLKASRPLAEKTARHNVQQHAGVVLMDGRRVTEIVPSVDGAAVSAVRCEARGGAPESYEADLVIDASSCGELTLEFLRATRRQVPEESTLGVDFHYSSALVEFADGHTPDFHPLMTMPNALDSSRVWFLLAREDQCCYIALGGRGKDAPPAGWPDFVEFAATLPTQTLHRSTLACLQ
jgi:2-polyprenyl-6-methoxyphenol hydroxylase-like FAD-dependent oxidoreductase